MEWKAAMEQSSRIRATINKTAGMVAQISNIQDVIQQYASNLDIPTDEKAGY